MLNYCNCKICLNLKNSRWYSRSLSLWLFCLPGTSHGSGILKYTITACKANWQVHYLILTKINLIEFFWSLRRWQFPNYTCYITNYTKFPNLFTTTVVKTANNYCKFTKHLRIVWTLSRGSFPFVFTIGTASFNIKPKIVELKTSIVFPIWRRRSSFGGPATFFVPDTWTRLSFHYHVFFVNLFHKEATRQRMFLGQNALLSWSEDENLMRLFSFAGHECHALG